MSIFEEKPNGKYSARRQFGEDDILQLAESIVQKRFQRGETMASPEATKRYLCLQMAKLDREVFGTLFLDSQHRLIANEELFQGTIDSASVHPRILMQRALFLNAAAVILYHNHPSGAPEPSAADRQVTDRISAALSMIDIRTLDHLIVAGVRATSFAERGWL